MSENELQHQAYDGISPQLFIEFLTKKGVKSNCQTCNSDSGWIIGAEIEGSIPAIITANKERSIIGTPYYPAIIMVCSNCGYIRSHSRQIVRDWINQENTEIKNVE
jgi:hypothetical protein